MAGLPELESLTGSGETYIITPEYRTALIAKIEAERPITRVAAITGLSRVSIYKLLKGQASVKRETYEALKKL